MSKVVFLQNAWSPLFAGKIWPRKSWLRALEKSRSGQRLVHLIDDFDLCEETTPVVTATSNGIAPPDFEHISEILIRRKPEIIITCGMQAEKALLKYEPHRLISVPHPAHRMLTNALYIQARNLIEGGFEGRIALRQLKGEVKIEEL
jgi:hypothetical protein